MKAAVYEGGGKPLVLTDLADPEPGPDDVVIKVHRCGICGTDLHMTEGHTIGFAPGTVPGHEYAGEIVAKGTNAGDFRIGDRITALPSTGCGHCEACFRGNLVLCSNAPGVMGGFGEYLKVPARVALKLPASLSLEDGALIEPLAIGLYGVRCSRIAAGDRVLVLGAGSIALAVIYWARRLGAGRIVAMSRSDRRAPMALEMGADAFIAYGENEVAETAAALGGSPDTVFECVGNPGYLAKGIQHVRKFGQLLSLGFCLEPDPIMAPMAAMKGVTIQFPVGYSMKDFEYVADVMDSGHVDPAILVTSVVPLIDLPAKLARLRGPNVDTKVQVLMTTQ
jgi:(R,R)-butanediol dehydrogenase/meso-butanediol dehydrogenase/diacetyl reductase